MNMKHFLAKPFTVYLFLAIIALLHCPFSFAYEEEIKDISANMAKDIADAGKKTIAVADFTDLQGNVTELGRFLAEEFSVALAGAGTRFEVVDRIHLKSIIREHKLSATGMIDPKTARKLGKIAGVQALITGMVTPFGDNVRVTVKLLDTETAKIIGASTANIAKTQAIEELLARGIETRSPYQQPTSSQYRPPTGTSMSKKAGPLVITSKNLNCKETNTGDYCFINTKTKTSFKIVYFQEDSKTKRRITVQPGQTQCIYDIPAGPYNYIITYKARVPIMPFPPGAPTTVENVTYLQGQIYVEKCKSINFEIK